MSYLCADGVYHHKSELPKSLQPFVDYRFSSGGVIGDDFKSFNTKFKNAVKKLLPEGYEIHDWHRNHYECSAVLKNSHGNYAYLSVSDVRFWNNEWFTNILIRTMDHEKDWTGGRNQRTCLFTLGEDIQKLYSNVYLRLNENRDWSAEVDRECPGPGAVLFVQEGKYPVEVYYERTDLNGSSVMEKDVCESRKDLIESLNWMGKCGYLPVSVWGFDVDQCVDRGLIGVFKAAIDQRAEALAKAQEEFINAQEDVDEIIAGAKDRVSVASVQERERELDM